MRKDRREGMRLYHMNLTVLENVVTYTCHLLLNYKEGEQRRMIKTKVIEKAIKT